LSMQKFTLFAIKDDGPHISTFESISGGSSANTLLIEITENIISMIKTTKYFILD